MSLALVVNSYVDKGPRFTPFLLLHEAHRRGRPVAVVAVEDLHLGVRGEVTADGLAIPPSPTLSLEALVQAINTRRHAKARMDMAAFQLVLMRNLPATHDHYGLTGNPAVAFGRYLRAMGSKVVNAPEGLAKASSKLYLFSLPDGTVPRTVVTRHTRVVRDTIEEWGCPVVLKPLEGYGGKEVFLVEPDRLHNLDAITDVIRSHSFVMVQEYVPEAIDGDVRVLMVGGKVLEVDGLPAAYQRRAKSDDFRSNIHAGAEPRPAEWTSELAETCARIGPVIAADGLMYVGVDVIGGKVIDLNVFNPGGLRLVSALQGVDFTPHALDALEGSAR